LSKLISFCGIICSECPAYIASQNNDDNARKELAKKLSKEFNTEIEYKDVNCDGCIATNGRRMHYCSICEIRKCGIEKKVLNCAYCNNFSCDKLDKFHENNLQLRENLNEIKKSI